MIRLINDPNDIFVFCKNLFFSLMSTKNQKYSLIYLILGWLQQFEWCNNLNITYEYKPDA